MDPRALIALVVGGVLVLGPRIDAAAYCLLKTNNTPDPYVAWQTLPVTYRVSTNVTDPQILAAIDQAFQTWQAVSCANLTFQKGASFNICTTTPCPAGTVPFQHNQTSINIFWFTSATGFPSSSQYVAYTNLLYTTQGAIIGAAIAGNAVKKTRSTSGSPTLSELDVQNEMVAFIGRAIGLDDSNVPGASMAPMITFGDISKRTLAQDDLDGLAYLYPVSGCPTPPQPGSNGCSTPPPPDGGIDATTTPDSAPLDAIAADGPVIITEAGADATTSDSIPPDSISTDSSGGGDALPIDSSADLVGGDHPLAADQTVSADQPITSSDTLQPAPDGSVSWDLAGVPDLGTGPYQAPEEDEGCCRVSHARSTGVPFVLILGLALLAALGRRRGKH
jgi:hypothetical protein